MVERDEGTMDNQINQTVERIGQLPDGEHPVYGLDYDNVPIEYLGTKDEIKALASAYTKAVSDLEKAKAGLETADRVVPTNWCDPLLTGDTSVFKQTEKWDGRDIEALLRGVQDRIREHAKQILEDGDGHVCKCCEAPCDCSSHLPCDGCYKCQNDPTLQMKP